MSHRCIRFACAVLISCAIVPVGCVVLAEDPQDATTIESPLPSTDAELNALSDELEVETLRLIERDDFPAAIKSGVRRLQVLRALYPQSRHPDGHETIVVALMHLASASRSSLQWDEASKYCQEALDMALQLERTQENERYNGAVASCYMQLGLLAHRRRDAEAACRAFVEAVSRNEAVYARDPSPDVFAELSSGLACAAAAFADAGKPAQAAEYWTKAEQAWQTRLAECDLDDLSQVEINVYSMFLQGRGESLISTSDFRDAIDYHEKCMSLEDYLVAKRGAVSSPMRTTGTLLLLGRAYQGAGYLTNAVDAFSRAVDACEGLCSKDSNPIWHLRLATGLTQLARVQLQLGNCRVAMQSAQKSREVVDRIFPLGSRAEPAIAWQVATHYGMYADVYAQANDHEEARTLAEQSLALWKYLHYEKGLPEAYRFLSISLDRVSSIMWLQNETTAAMELAEEAVEIQRKVHPLADFPNGHPELLASLINTALTCHEAGDIGRARRYADEAIQLWRRRVTADSTPRDRADFAVVLQHAAAISAAGGDWESAITFYDEADATCAALAGQGIVTALDQALLRIRQARVYLRAGDLDRAKDTATEALNHCEESYAADKHPDGHPRFAEVLLVGAEVWYSAGETSRAADWCLRGARMAAAFQLQHVHGLSETEGLNLLSSDRSTRDILLSICRSSSAPLEEFYEVLWAQQGAVQRALADQRALRHRIASLTGEARKTLEEYQFVSGKLTQALLQGLAEDEEGLRQLTRQKEALQRSLASAGGAKNHQARSAGSHRELMARLPEDTAFVDLVHYAEIRRRQEADTGPAPESAARYAAFVVQNGRPLEFIDLGPAAEIHAAAAEFRKAIAQNSLAGTPRNRLRLLVWERIEQLLAPYVEWVYICPDAGLTTIPWGALPGRNGREPLLAKYGISVVPSGAFLLEQLTTRSAAEPPASTVLLVGDVDFGNPPANAKAELLVAGRSALLREGHRYWSPLPASRTEIERIAELAEARSVVTLAGTRASVGSIAAEMPRARWVHLATHGFFAATALTSAGHPEHSGDESDSRILDPFRERVTVAERNPLLLSGLVLAGANVPAGDDGAGATGVSAIMTAESISYLPLQDLELVVLSACETGLGDVASGEGVLGLQRAFHTAGAKNVIASLWKIDDDATAVLMHLFYEKMWRERKPPLQALREAQLQLYRSPDLIEHVQRRRGIDPAKTSPIRKPAEPTVATTPPQLWAAFTLSGWGR